MRDGSIRHCHNVGHPVFDDSGGLVEYIGTTLDVTERKRADEERERAHERLRQAQADLARVSRVTTMGELTASLAHEVNQPIAAVVTNAGACERWLRGEAPNLEEARAAAMRSVKDGKRAAEIMADRVQLQQVLMNLIVNSIDAMKDVDGARELVIKPSEKRTNRF